MSSPNEGRWIGRGTIRASICRQHLGGDLLRCAFVVAATSAVLLCACGDDGDFPEEVVDNFMAGCTAQPGATESYCRCSIREIQKNVSFEEFQRLESSITDRNRFPDRLVEAVGGCVDELK